MHRLATVLSVTTELYMVLTSTNHDCKGALGDRVPGKRARQNLDVESQTACIALSAVFVQGARGDVPSDSDKKPNVALRPLPFSLSAAHLPQGPQAVVWRRRCWGHVPLHICHLYAWSVSFLHGTVLNSFSASCSISLCPYRVSSFPPNNLLF